MNKRRFVLALMPMFLMLPLGLPLVAKAADAPLTFNVASMNYLELQAARAILLKRLSFLLEQRLTALRAQRLL